jgi:hypothetical protein
MSDKNRCHISIPGPLYEHLRAYAKARNVSIASIIEQIVAPALGHEPVPVRPARRYRGK